MLDIIWAGLAIICIVIGILGSVLPVIPGPPISFLALLIVMWAGYADFSNDFLLLWGFITVLVTIFDYFLPIWFTKKFGGSKKATWGATIGLIIGLFLGPIGIILGPFAGALIGEMIHDSSNNAKAWRVAFGAFLAFIFGTGAKLVASGMMGYYVFVEIFS